MGIERAEVIARMRKAYREGVSATTFIWQVRSEGLGYRRQTMLSDWRSVNELEKKAGAMRFVRKNYVPSKMAVAEVDWDMKQEYMYKVKTQAQLRPGEPPTERFVNIMSDRLLTPAEVESQVYQRWGEWEKYAPEKLVSLQVWTAVHRSELWEL